MLKRKIKIGIAVITACLCAASLAVSGCTRRKIANVDSKGSNIVCFGDSITAGMGVDKDDSFPSILAKMTNIPVINSGIEGDISADGLKRIEQDVLDRDPLLVIIEFGGNDFLRKIPMEETVSNIEEMVKKVLAKGAMAAIADISASGVIMEDYKDKFREISNKYDIIFIPSLLSGIITDPMLKSDFLHPNVRGYQIVSHRVYRAILPYLNQNKLINNARNLGEFPVD